MKPPPDVLREHVRHSVATRNPIDDAEQRCIAEMLERFDALAAPFDEDADPVHVTGSAIVVGRRGVLLLKHKRLGLWLQPGGHIDAGETPWDAARREVVEETGMHVRFFDGTPELVHVSVHDVPGGHTHLDMRYLFDGGDADPAPPLGESQDVHWFEWPDAIVRAEPSLTSILRHLQARVA